MEELSMKETLKAGDERKVEEDFFQYIVIRLGDEQYGIDIRYIDNIVRMQHITRVPKVPAYLKGVINLRGEDSAGHESSREDGTGGRRTDPCYQNHHSEAGTAGQCRNHCG